MIEDLRAASEAVGIQAFITNSDERIETQLNKLTGHEDLPILLISWNLQHNLVFTADNFLQNPSVPITCLLMAKADAREKELYEETAFEMGQLFQAFLIKLNETIISYQTDTTTPAISGASYTIVPKYGAGKHSGVLGNFTMKARIVNCEEVTVANIVTPPTPTKRGIGFDSIGSTKIK